MIFKTKVILKIHHFLIIYHILLLSCSSGYLHPSHLCNTGNPSQPCFKDISLVTWNGQIGDLKVGVLTARSLKNATKQALNFVDFVAYSV